MNNFFNKIVLNNFSLTIFASPFDRVICRWQSWVVTMLFGLSCVMNHVTQLSWNWLPHSGAVGVKTGKTSILPGFSKIECGGGSGGAPHLPSPGARAMLAAPLKTMLLLQKKLSPKGHSLIFMLINIFKVVSPCAVFGLCTCCCVSGGIPC